MTIRPSTATASRNIEAANQKIIALLAENRDLRARIARLEAPDALQSQPLPEEIVGNDTIL
ncbi:MAG: hypothetical protein U1A72_11720 [Sulfuritalea sp.]|nr:hypothetical protein [Sulfuritalea sp.]